MKQSIFVIVTLMLTANLLTANNNTTFGDNKLKLISGSSVAQHSNLKAMLEAKGIRKATISKSAAAKTAPIPATTLKKLRQSMYQKLSAKSKKAPTINITPDKLIPPPNTPQTNKKSSNNKFQGEMETLPTNTRMVAEFEESQAVLVSIPTGMAFVFEGALAECWFEYDMDTYVADLLKYNEIPKDFTVDEDIPAGYGWFWPVAQGYGNYDIDDIFIIPDSLIIRVPFPYWTEDAKLYVNGGQANLWGKLIYSIQQAGATAWIRYSGVGIETPGQEEFDTTFVKSIFEEKLDYPLTNYVFVSNTLEDAFWCRDWGPFGIYYDDAEGNRKLGFMDAKYYTGRKFDDEFNRTLYDKFGYDYYDLDVKMEGGNIMNDGFKYGTYGDVVHAGNSAPYGSYGQYVWDATTEQWKLEPRAPLTAAQTNTRIQQAFNFEGIVMESLEYDGGTGHIDLWSKQFDEESILIAFGEGTPAKYSVLTDYKTVQRNREKYKSLKTAFGTNYRLLNAPMPRLDSSDMPINDGAYNLDPRGYLNGITVNNYYIYPSFSTPEDDNWKLDSTNNEILKKLLPGYVLVPIDSRLLTTGGGAIHCITMQIPQDADKVITIRHKPIRDNVEPANSFELTAELVSNPNNMVKMMEVAWRVRGGDWQPIIMQLEGNEWKTTITGGFEQNDTIDYYIAAENWNSTLKTAPITAKDDGYANGGYYSFWFNDVSIDELYGYQPSASVIASVYPNPATDYINVVFENIKAGNVKMDILNTMGQVIQTPINQYLNNGVFTFDVTDLNLTTGVYIIKMATDSGISTANFIVK